MFPVTIYCCKLLVEKGIYLHQGMWQQYIFWCRIKAPFTQMPPLLALLAWCLFTVASGGQTYGSKSNYEELNEESPEGDHPGMDGTSKACR